MPKFKILYHFAGNGEVFVIAKDEKEAKENFFNCSDLYKETEWKDDHKIDEVIKINE